MFSCFQLIFLWLFCASIFPLQGSFAATPLSIENQIRAYITSHQTEQLSLLEQLVNINSSTNNIQGVQQVGELLRRQFEELGFKTKWVQEPPDMKRASTLVATRQGNKGKRILLIGHLDTVFAKDSPFQTFKRHDNIATGPGVIDDKGGDVVILYALKALASVNGLDDTTITIVLTGDEEESGKPTSISRRPLFQAASMSDIALDFEPAVNQNTATIARRGITNWTIEASGHESHSAGIFKHEAGFGAIFELARILNTMRVNLSKEKYLTFNPGWMLGGTLIQSATNAPNGHAFGQENVIAKSAIAKGDLRYLTLTQKLDAEHRIETIVNDHLPGTSASIHFEDGIPAMSPTSANLKLLEQYSKTSSDLGYQIIKPLDPGQRGAGDISYIAAKVSASISGLGALGSGAHSTKESLDCAWLSIQTERAAIFIYRLTHYPVDNSPK